MTKFKIALNPATPFDLYMQFIARYRFTSEIMCCQVSSRVIHLVIAWFGWLLGWAYRFFLHVLEIPAYIWREIMDEHRREKPIIATICKGCDIAFHTNSNPSTAHVYIVCKRPLNLILA